MEQEPAKKLTALTIEAFKNITAEDVIILDTRPAGDFTAGFVPGSIFIGLEGRFEEWAAAILPANKNMVLITAPGAETATAGKLYRMGFDSIQGYLEGGFDTWVNAGEPVDLVIDIEADELAMDIPHDKNLLIVDVRRDTEFADGHVKGAVNIPLDELTDVAVIAEFDDHKNLYIHCAAGYRSVIAASLLKKHGLHNLRNIVGGWEEIKNQGKITVEKDKTAMN
ncbi:MAG TPA: rhodanese-like domain-containing protein [Ferruginibacter sp.]|mgnify:CR=1 FL=1|nr:rhodanese-like domain-containing protein [Ferruginibacter sp.]HMP21051.1 rhodanese-like domain-containing protein [Ferruginibacter sp.]